MERDRWVMGLGTGLLGMHSWSIDVRTSHRITDSKNAGAGKGEVEMKGPSRRLYDSALHFVRTTASTQ